MDSKILSNVQIHHDYSLCKKVHTFKLDTHLSIREACRGTNFIIPFLQVMELPITSSDECAHVILTHISQHFWHGSTPFKIDAICGNWIKRSWRIQTHPNTDWEKSMTSEIVNLKVMSFATFREHSEANEVYVTRLSIIARAWKRLPPRRILLCFFPSKIWLM